MTESLTRSPALDGNFDRDLVEVLFEFAHRTNEGVSWKHLAGIPSQSLAAGRLRRVANAMSLGSHTRDEFLRASPRHAEHLAALTRDDARAAALFRFACLGEAATKTSIDALLGADFVLRAIERGAFQLRGDTVQTWFLLIPYGERAYLSDARPHATRDDHPVYVGPNSAIEIEYCRSRLHAPKFRRGLEIGAGTGIVVIELAALCDEWVGVDRDERSVAFCRANAALHRVSHASFASSDLFNAVSGRFDLIVFNPWQPSESQVDLIDRFVRESAEYLTEEGRVILFIESARVGGSDPVVDRIRGAMATSGLSGVQRVLGAHRRGGEPGGIAVSSALSIGRDPRQPGRLRTNVDSRSMHASLRRTVLAITGR